MVASGIDWNTFKNKTRSGNEQIMSFESLALGIQVPTEVSDLLKIDSANFNNFRRKHLMTNSQFHNLCREGLEKYALMINQDEGVSTLEEESEDKIGRKDMFLFAFCTS